MTGTRTDAHPAAQPAADEQHAADALRAWPAHAPLACWCWPETHAPGAPVAAHLAPVADTRTLAPGDHTLAELDALLTPANGPRPPDPARADHGWLAVLDYDLTRLLEPRLAEGRTPPPVVAELHRIEGATRVPLAPPTTTCPSPSTPPYTLGPFESELAGPRAASAYPDLVARVLGYIRAGDCYQTNLTHALRAPFAGSARALFADLLERTAPRHAAYVESPTRAIASISPELFLEIDPAGLAITRPMKGTRPLDADPAELAEAEKDRAELAMIVDLMRNDLGRLAIPGSVRVRTPHALERHDAGVLQATATVEARLPEGTRPSDLLHAVFPPGSVTGAPKIRAQQIIDELEPSPRGPYCGCIGFFGDDGSIRLNVAIRTAVVEGASIAPGVFPRASLTYRVGAGIVADSDPHAELAETMLKAEAITRLVNTP